jgi:hypothetical protein
MKLFRTLAEDEAETYRAWARRNYVPFSEIPGTWHPIIQIECARINEETDDIGEIDDDLTIQ